MRREVTPNPSFEARPNGRPPGPGRRYAYIFTGPRLASCRWSRLNSNVRPQKETYVLQTELRSSRSPQDGFSLCVYDRCMTSKHFRWQASWEIDQGEGVARHDTGLRVRLQDGRGEAENAEEVIRSLVPKHGAHNAPAMVQRLVREGTQLLIDPHSRGWRG